MRYCRETAASISASDAVRRGKSRSRSCLTAAPPCDAIFGLFDKCWTSDRVATGIQRLEHRPVVFHDAPLHVGPILPSAFRRIAAVFLQHLIADELLGFLRVDVALVAAPRIGIQSPQPLAAIELAARGDFYRVEMDVPRQGTQIDVVFDELRLEAALKNVTRAVVLVARVKRVGRQKPLHEPRKVRPRRADEEVKMVVHEHVGVKRGGRQMQVVGELRRNTARSSSWKKIVARPFPRLVT